MRWRSDGRWEEAVYDFVQEAAASPFCVTGVIGMGGDPWRSHYRFPC
jgi:hypothetical protein